VRVIDDKMGLGLSHPVTSKVLHRMGTKSYRIGGAQMQGWRETMEDAHSITFELPHHTDSVLFGVFDGHAGNKCSPYVAKNLSQYLDKVSWEDPEALVNACLDCDDAFLSDPQYSGLEDGSTAAFSLVTHDAATDEYKTINGNVGDSRTVLGRRKEDGSFEAVALTEDHKPTDEGERNRIMAAGGMVQLGRVNGQLALSRAFGDRALKTGGSDRSKRKVCAVPEFKIEKVKPGDFLFIACDGIYESDVFSRDSVVAFIASELKRTDDLAQICAAVLDQCLSRGSKDNMTAVLIEFKDGRAYHQADIEYIPGPYHPGKEAKKFQEAYKADAEAAGFTLEEAMRRLAENAKKKFDEQLASVPKEDRMDVDKTAEVVKNVEDKEKDDSAPLQESPQL